jgi:myo-inositol 2-dehydrogenase/D-chiro-inositol 1-dehydrogenase
LAFAAAAGRETLHCSGPCELTLRYGIAGTGMMGLEHLRSLQALPGAEITALADPDPRSLEAAATEAGPATALYGSATEMVVAGDIDVLVVASPNFTHHEVLESVWGTSLHVLVEKPLATTLEDALSITRRAASHQGIVWVGLEYRYVPAIARLLAEVRAGRVGRVRMVGVREHRFPFLEKVGNWNRFNRFTGGTLVEKCCHFFDLMNLVIGSRPVRVFASGAMDVNHLDERYGGERPDVIDNALVVLEYPEGARASLDLCMFAEGSRYEQELVVVGDAGKVEALVPGFMEAYRGRQSALVVGSRGEGWPVEVSEIGPEGRGGYMGHHHGSTYLEHVGLQQAIRAGERAKVGVEDGLWSVIMGLAAQRSIAEGRVVEISELVGAAGPTGSPLPS